MLVNLDRENSSTFVNILYTPQVVYPLSGSSCQSQVLSTPSCKKCYTTIHITHLLLLLS